MKTISDASRLLTEKNTIGEKELSDLLQFFSEDGEGISFYLGWPEVHNNAHRDEAIVAKDLFQCVDHRAPKELSTDVAADLKKMKQRVEQVRSGPNRLQVIFACCAQDLWRVLELPCHNSSSIVEVGQYFRVVPLFAALQKAKMYGVVLIETGKARVFLVRGAEIEEIMDVIESVDLSLHADDARVGWSDHIDRNQQAHERAFLKHVAAQIREFAKVNQLDTVVIGCREEIWAELESQLDKPRILRAERFHLPYFSIGGGEVVKHAEPIFLSLEKRKVEEVLRTVHENSGASVVGASNVLALLREGNARKVVLGNMASEVASECRACGHVSAGSNTSCALCGGIHIGHLAAEEAVLRRALLSGADVLIAEAASVSFDGVAALLRY